MEAKHTQVFTLKVSHLNLVTVNYRKYFDLCKYFFQVSHYLKWIRNEIELSRPDYDRHY